MGQRHAARRQLAEHDVQIRDDGQRDRRADADAHRELDGERQLGELIARTRRRARLSASAPSAEARERDAELACREHPREISGGAEGEARLPVAGARHRLEPRPSRADQRELGGDEEAVEEQENDDGDQAREHGVNLGRPSVTVDPDGRRELRRKRSVMAHSHAHHHHGHSHGHGHTHGPVARRTAAAASTRALTWSLVLTRRHSDRRGRRRLAVELAGPAGRRRTRAHRRGRARSVAVRRLARAPAGLARRRPIGYLRWEILAALINGATLLLISVWIVIEAVMRFKASGAGVRAA